MGMRTRQPRRSAATKGALSVLALAASANAFVVPKAGAEALGSSSVRRSLNFGPKLHKAHHSVHDPSPALALFNAQSGSVDGLVSACASSDQNCVGRGIASGFIKSLYNFDGTQFELESGVVSKHNGVWSGHFVQRQDGLQVANAFLNVNVDLKTGEVISYGDSSYFAQPSAKSDSADVASEWKKRVAGWADKAERVAGQVVFGASDADDNLSAYSSPSINSRPAVLRASSAKGFEVYSTLAGTACADPREGLLSFLNLQASKPEVTAFLAAASRGSIIDAMSVQPSLDSMDGYTITNVPSAVAPVKAQLVYLQDGEGALRLSWKYEVQTDDNHYSSFVSADSPAGQEDILEVVDWVRDFRPTGGEAGYESLQTVGGFARPSRRERKAATHSAQSIENVKALRREVDQAERVLTDLTAIDAFKKVQPAYRVFPWGVNAPDGGKRETLQGTLVELDSEASPAGWHVVPAAGTGEAATIYLDTRGNNVLAQDNVDGGNGYLHNWRPSGGANLTFDWPLGWPKPGTPLEPSTYINASVTELFYTNNEIHDLFYRYGFDEVAGNFQEYNFGKGGLGGDAVQANAQDGSGTNNANFATPPDGQRPRMRMYYWTGQQPYRDGDFEAGIVIHEYAHGISTRLTGGPANSNCLGWGEAGGMGEGWGDFFATMIRMHSTKEKEFAMGEWASGRAGGIRNYRYSQNETVNLDFYNSLDKPGYWGVHAIGEVWAEILFEIAEILIDSHGFHPSLFPPSADASSSVLSEFYKEVNGLKVPKHGNTLALQLVVDGMKLQPCRPSFQDARDAILAADKVLTGGENFCAIYQGFAKRGLGPEASVIGSTPWGGGRRTNDFAVPKKCAKAK